MRLLEAGADVSQRVAAIGDVGVIGRVRARARSAGVDAIFAALAPALAGADWGFANLEFPIGRPEWVRGGRAAEFHHDDDVPEALFRAGARVVSLANNHVMDCGERGLARTLETCRNAGLEVVGAGATLEAARRPARFVAAGRRVAVLGYFSGKDGAASATGWGFAPLERGAVTEDVAAARAAADIVVVSVHWGSMYVDFPPPRVMEWAETFESLGVDLVLGHHPHVLQGYRRRGRTLTLFSLGDAVLDPASGDFEAEVAGEARRATGVFTASLGAAPGLDFTPLRLDAEGVPEAVTGADEAAVRERVLRLAAGLEGAESRFASESAPMLLRYEWQSLTTYMRQGRWGRVARLLTSLRPRHVPMLWSALRHRGGRNADADPVTGRTTR